MADNNFTNTSSIETNAFIKGMTKDPHASFVEKQNWTHARNAVNNSVDGDVGVIGNEPANIACSTVPYPIIGAVHRYADQWVIFATDDINSEIGLFDDSLCEYKTLINAPCLNFNRKHLITGAAKENFDCTWQVYWDDGNNPSRTLNINNIPYVRIIVSPPGADCIEYEDTTELDCEKLRLAPLLSTPCINLTKASDGGQLRNGSYQAFIAYTVNGQRQTDYIGVSNVQSLFDHSGTAGSLHLSITDLDRNFDYYELVILSNNQQNTVAKRIGLYSTEQSDITIDYIDQSLITVPLELIPLRSPAYERSDQMYVVNDWLIRSGPTEQFDFNYQPLANQITTQWVVAEYPSSYYYKGGNKTGFMRDEQYAFFIRWIYNTGERSSSYHIPGRAPRLFGKDQWGRPVDEIGVNGGIDSLSPDEYNFQIYNTATETQTGLSDPTGDGGTIIAKGDMAYWQSTERYPATRPDIWNANNNPAAPWAATGNPQHDLCGKPIRHHKMPSEETSPNLHIFNSASNTIRILGVQFDNISLPRFNDGTVIPNIVGYEILRGSREGQKSILAKGIFRNMRTYNIPNSENELSTSIQGLYPNYPYNDLRPDVYFHDGTKGVGPAKRTDGCNDFTASINKFPPLTGYKKNVFTFHAPDLMFKRPFLNAYETRMYGELSGNSIGYFIKSENHPQNKLIRNSGLLLSGIIGIGYALNQINGTKSFTMESPGSQIDSSSNNLQILGNPSSAPGTGSPNVTLVNPAGTGTYQLNLNARLITANSAYNILNSTLSNNLIPTLVDGGATNRNSIQTYNSTYTRLGRFPGVIGAKYNTTYTYNSSFSALPGTLRTVIGAITTIQNISIGAQEIIDLLYNLISYGDFAYKHNSHGTYTNYTRLPVDNPPSSSVIRFRSKNIDSNYIGSNFQQFAGTYKINNLFRPGTVAVASQNDFSEPFFTTDISRYTIGGDASTDFSDTYIKEPGVKQKKPISCLYGALKFSFENQYGQLDGIKQVQMRGCIELVDTSVASRKFRSQPIFSGDTYVGRYTEKTIMPIFTDFLYGQPDQYPYDYLKRVNIPYPRFWMDTRKYDTSRLARLLSSAGFLNPTNLLPNDLFYLDRGSSSCGDLFQILSGSDPNPAFAMEYAYMYTHCNGVQDFYVESEINLAQRDWEDDPRFRHYDPYEYNNVDDLFNAAIIRDGNFYKYDYSLSVSRFLTNLSSFGNMQTIDYDPTVAEKCYSYYPKRLIYSLQAQVEAKKDFWRVFLPNNYKDFKNKVNIIKPINKNGAIIFFPYQSPQMFQGLDTLETGLGTKLTIGDGGLFSQPFQNITNADLPHEYGSCESSRSVANTPFGIFFISQAQGKVFQYSGSLVNIANAGMKWWFNKYLPSVLIRQFPELEDSKLSDNSVIGIGCQTIYDINDDIVYFTKKDYAVKPEYLDIVTFNPTTQKFMLNGTTVLPLGDPLFFDNCSWTVSYDPKAQAWISFHDWHPELVMPSIRHFLTTKTIPSQKPYCPPGYSFNPSTNVCERSISKTSPATVTVSEVKASISGSTVGCKVDIVLAVDVSASTGGANGSIGLVERAVVSDFINDPIIQTGLANGDIQIGIVAWADNDVSMNPNTYSMSNTLTAAQVDSWLVANWTTVGTGTDLVNAMSATSTVVNNKSLSQLGNRTTVPNFRQYMIIVTDASTIIPPAWINVGCQYQSISLGGSCFGPYYQNVIAVQAVSTISLSNPAVLQNITCSQSFYEYYIAADDISGVSQVAYSIAGQTCNPNGYDCKCPTGYTLVYPDKMSAPIRWTQPFGDCVPDLVPNTQEEQYAPICRKVTCNCPPPPASWATTTTTGQCDDVYLSGPNGDPSYVNKNPLICNYFVQYTSQPSYLSGTLWRHNDRCDLYSNFYGISYPWEVELTETTGQNVNTVRSVEYQLESYVYKGDLINECGDDRWHDLDWNFDEAILYNSEQVSGLLKLELNPKDDPFGMMQYPIIGANDIRIIFSKEEQKYRFNQFWDITRDRGEFTSTEERIFFTQLNGYIRDLNSLNLNYQKPSDQRKKFRHYYNKLILRRQNSADRKMLLKLVNTKLNLSFR